MSKLRLGWLWIIVALEVIGIGVLLVWALVFRNAEPSVTRTPSVQDQKPTPTYNTPKVELKKVLEGFKEPVAIVAAPNDTNRERLFVVEQGGTIRVATTTGQVTPDAFLDVTSKIKSGGEQGLLGLAFHPKINEKPYFYVNYTDKAGDTIVARYTIKIDMNEVFSVVPNSEKVLLKINQPYANHNGGALAFGPDGYLYIGTGDGGSGGDPGNRAQNNNELLGKMLRINVDGGDPYAIPGDNPLIKEGGKPEIWASGLRNPWRFSFDRKTGDLYIADVGQGAWEEINFQPASSKGVVVNYGWRCYEGTHDFNTQGCQAATAYTKPVIEYEHTENRCSVTGGYVYRGTKFPALAGKYFYGDFCGGQVYYAEQISAEWKSTPAATSTYKLSTFGEDSIGELYLADYESGMIYQVTDTAN